MSEASLELSPWVRLEKKSVFTFTARLEKAQLVQRLSLQFHRFLEEPCGLVGWVRSDHFKGKPRGARLNI